MFGLYTKRQMEDEIEKRMKHGTDTLKVGEPVPVNGDCCCEPCPEEDF